MSIEIFFDSFINGFYHTLKCVVGRYALSISTRCKKHCKLSMVIRNFKIVKRYNYHRNLPKLNVQELLISTTHGKVLE